MKYAMLIHYQPGYYEVLSEDEQKTVIGEYRALAQDPRARGSEQLQPTDTATTVRVAGGQKLITDGPHEHTNESFGAFYTFEVDTLDDAIELAARLPAARFGGAVEIRPLVQR